MKHMKYFDTKVGMLTKYQEICYCCTSSLKDIFPEQSPIVVEVLYQWQLDVALRLTPMRLVVINL